MRLPFDLGAVAARVLSWYNEHSQRDRRVILGVVVATGLSLGYLGVIEPILDYRKAVEQDIADGQEELERAMRFLAAKETLRAERDDLKKRLTQAKARLLPGGTATLGAAALQERANALAADKGITVQSTQVMKEEVLEPFRKVAVRLTLSGELKPLADFVSGIEYGQQLTVPYIEVSRRGAVLGAKGPRTLSVTVEVNGFVQAGVKGDGKPEGAEEEGAGVQEATGEGEPAQAGATPETTNAPAGGAPSAASTTSTTFAVAPASTLPPATFAPPAATIVPSTVVPITLPTFVVPVPEIPSTTPAVVPESNEPQTEATDGDGQGEGDADDEGEE